MQAGCEEMKCFSDCRRKQRERGAGVAMMSDTSLGGAAASGHAPAGGAHIVRCVVCGGPCDAADAATRQGAHAAGLMCLFCFRAACEVVGEGGAEAGGEGDAGEGADDVGEGADDAVIAAAVDAADWGAALEGWLSPGSSLIDVGESAVE